MRGWIYKTDEAGRPRRFLSHGEAAWWAVQRVGAIFLPLFFGPVLWAIFGDDPPGPWWTAIPVILAVACTWAAVVATICLYLVLSGGVMGEAERRRYRENGGRSTVRPVRPGGHGRNLSRCTRDLPPVRACA